MNGVSMSVFNCRALQPKPNIPKITAKAWKNLLRADAADVEAERRRVWGLAVSKMCCSEAAYWGSTFGDSY